MVFLQTPFSPAIRMTSFSLRLSQRTNGLMMAKRRLATSRSLEAKLSRDRTATFFSPCAGDSLETATTSLSLEAVTSSSTEDAVTASRIVQGFPRQTTLEPGLKLND